ncbi:epithelial discoidin domain-containing receptor 1 [Platysternon megacephalum]|uniref:Epithelial discoidin domain-containing receptor 1 n=1 Tax=Platysternon megacephalum TaxID=55544 RepID=A0A4D9DLL3_9SAUR|nr:epithelial discoidin domain-containing receptor 1 [Platysternon megacephalum]
MYSPCPQCQCGTDSSAGAGSSSLGFRVNIYCEATQSNCSRLLVRRGAEGTASAGRWLGHWSSHLLPTSPRVSSAPSRSTAGAQGSTRRGMDAAGVAACSQLLEGSFPLPQASTLVPVRGAIGSSGWHQAGLPVSSIPGSAPWAPARRGRSHPEAGAAWLQPCACSLPAAFLATLSPALQALAAPRGPQHQGAPGCFRHPWACPPPPCDSAPQPGHSDPPPWGTRNRNKPQRLTTQPPAHAPHPPAHAAAPQEPVGNPAPRVTHVWPAPHDPSWRPWAAPTSACLWAPAPAVRCPFHPGALRPTQPPPPPLL